MQATDTYFRNLPIAPALRYKHPGLVAGKQVPCPCCGKPSWPTGTSLVCPNKSCEWGAGGAFEYLETVASDSFMEVFRSLYTQQTYSDGELKQHRSLRRHERRLRRFIYIAAKRSPSASMRLVSGAVYLRKKYDLDILDVDHRRSFVMLHTSEIYDFVRACRVYKKNLKIPPQNSSVVFLWPVFGDYHTLVGFYYAGIDQAPVYVPLLDNYRIGYIGIADCYPTMKPIVASGLPELTRNPDKVLAVNLSGSINPSTGLIFRWDARQPLSINLGVVLYNLSRTDILEPYKGKSSKLEVFENSKIKPLFVQELINNPSVEDVLSQLRPDFDLMKSLQEGLMESGYNQKASEVMSYYENTARYVSSSGHVFTQSQDGYRMYRKGNLENMLQVTNFTLQVKSVVHCRESGRGFTIFEAAHNGRNEEIVVTDKLLHKPRDLERIVQNAFLSADRKTNPIVFEPTQMKYMMPWFNLQKERSEYCRGVEFLGWDSDNTSFTAPRWFMDSRGGTSDIKQRPHPDEAVLSHFEYTPFSNDQKPDPGDMSPIISMCVAMCARSFIGLHLQPVCIRDTEDSDSVVRNFFLGLGQVNPLPISVNLRTNDYNTFRGFPFYGRSSDRNQASSVKNGCFILTDSGMRVSKPPKNWGPIWAAADKVMQACITWLIETRGSEVRRIRSAIYDQELISEGNHIIKEYLKFREWPDSTSVFFNLDQFLAAVPEGETSKWFTLDMEKQTVTIKKGPISIGDDLKQLVDVFKETKHTYEVDAISAGQLLKHYYSGVPEMTQASSTSA